MFSMIRRTLDTEQLDPSRLFSSGQVTDTYLLALAHAHGGRLATFDRRLVTDAVPQGHQILHFIH
jgi:predicted nucleic acid-binding protein